MMDRFKKFASLAKLTPQQRSAARAVRMAGNQARDERQWHKAQQHYSEYLNLRSDDFSIWVQLGHVCKEAGDLDAAESAYERARLINPADSDLLLNLGHLRKRQNLFEEAHLFFTQAANIDGNQAALKELNGGWIPATPSLPIIQSSDERRSETEEALAELIKGAKFSMAPGLSLGEEPGLFQFSGMDPQIHFSFTDAIASSKVAVLKIAFEKGEYFPSDFGTLFYDLGAGFQAGQMIMVPYSEGSICEVTLLLAAPALVRGLRWDPIEGAGAEIRLRHIHVEAISSLNALHAAVRCLEATQFADPDVADTLVSADEVCEGLAPFFTKDRLFEADYAVMQPFLTPWSGRHHAYSHWRHIYANPSENDYATMDRMIEEMPWRPRFSFVMPVYNTPPQLLCEVLDAMLEQNYPDFEICLADDCSPNAEVLQILEDYAARCPQVKFVRRKTNGHISLASNSAAKLATGDFIVLVDHDDLIPRYALFVVAAYLNRFPDARILFSDEDKISPSGIYFNPYFKSCFNQYLMYGHNMVSHLGVYQRALFEEVGGFYKGLEGSQDYDLTLRCIDRVDPHQIIHIPHVLYHWRQVPGSTSMAAEAKDYAAYAARNAINRQMQRQNLPLASVEGHAPGNHAIDVTHELDTSISIIIPTRNGIDVLDDCLRSIGKCDTVNTEVVIVDNDSDDPEALAYLGRVAKIHPTLKVRVLKAPGAFNFSAINNLAVENSTGDIVCFLNNDTRILSKSWLIRARGLLAMEEVGMVGGRLLYPDNTIQHFGIVTGMSDHHVAGGVHLFEDGNGYGYFSKHRMMGEFTAVTAACMFVRRADFDAVGGFETDLAVAYNDIDLCLKIRAIGRRILCDPSILVEHKESKSRGSDTTPEKAERLEREAAWMRARWGEQLLEDPYYSPNLSLKRPDFSLAYPPRQAWPWQLTDDKPSIASGAIARAPRFFSAKKRNDQGFLAICAILKNEAINILEWIAYHRALGVEKFYLYNNNSTDNVDALLEPLIEIGLVDLIDWPIRPAQLEAYDDFVDRHRHNWTWTAFIDLDEFINPLEYDSIIDWLQGFKEASAIAVQWMNFGPDGHNTPPDGLLIENYTTRLPDDHAMHGHVKTIVRTADYVKARSPHSMIVSGRIVDEHGEDIDQSVDYAILPVRKHRSICINHYYTRSRSEWAAKLNKGLADHRKDTTVSRNPAWLETYEREAIVPDVRIARFADATRLMLTELGLPAGPQLEKI
ncbi:hypothetical protein A0U87_03985 [Sphingobium sp. MP9-4]|uniref:glycosyltransferase n=1 Tax=Sphingobium sp. MP9-4 TaxID=1761936 RepID=UPI0010CA7E70|nr:glycosyltransferase [Sphingobium sp. MP9-4]TKV41686.1 hypothetical protein A0U87_03985 [Sphingobium sp. MP9-4]